MEKMEVGTLVLLENGWYLDTETNTRFRIDEDGNVFDSDGSLLQEGDE